MWRVPFSLASRSCILLVAKAPQQTAAEAGSADSKKCAVAPAFCTTMNNMTVFYVHYVLHIVICTVQSTVPAFIYKQLICMSSGSSRKKKAYYMLKPNRNEAEVIDRLGKCVSG
ncbi:unnamed protein product [Fusarium graminearum]|uniref:Chromosome 2, complete genome n=1 Tax=Gibberella zeae (strain ATCC MYA-4620 / CBS 123657 / FGSC 9075 / NRRL 31084 / PH-1) TaxID=229533 RepID=A0A098DM47_GIBZE|nr:unnamed protein product [Fusarium graminearum]